MKVIVLLCVLAAFLNQGEAVKCYECSASGTDGNCKTGSCEGAVCVKAGCDDEGGTFITKKTCGADLGFDGCQKTPWTTYKSCSVCACKGDWCNSATSVKLSWTSVMFGFVALIGAAVFRNLKY